MEKYQNARHHRKIDVNVAKILTTCWVMAGSPKYVIPTGKASANPIMARDVKAGGPGLISSRVKNSSRDKLTNTDEHAWSHIRGRQPKLQQSPDVLCIHEESN